MRHLAGYVTLFLLSAVAAAQPPVTVPRCAEPPVIDGRLDEGCWSSAAALGGFVQTKPGDNAPPSRATSVLLAYDAQALYIGIRASDDPSKVRATVARRDDVLDDDHVVLYLDTFDDRRRAYVLIFNPLGIQQDGIYTEGREIDYSVDVVMQSKGASRRRAMRLRWLCFCLRSGIAPGRGGSGAFMCSAVSGISTRRILGSLWCAAMQGCSIRRVRSGGSTSFDRSGCWR
jgi:hypothetical protein